MADSKSAKGKETSVINAGLWSVIGTVLVKGTYFLTIPLYSRILSTADYGEVNIFMTYASIFTIVISLYLAASVSAGSIKFQEKKHDFLASVVCLSLIVFALLGVVFEIFHVYFEHILDISWMMLNCLLLYSFSLHLINLNSSSLVMDYKYKRNAAISFVALLMDTILSVVLITTTFDNECVTGRIIGATIPNVCVGSIIMIYLLIKGRNYFNFQYWKYALTISVPLIFHGLGHLVLGQADRIMIKRMVGSSEAGIYALIYNLAVMMNAVQDALNNVWIPWLFRKLKTESYKEIKKVASVYVLIFTIGTILIMTFASEMIKILAPKEYWEGISCTVPLIFSTFIGFLYTLYVNVEIYFEQSKGIAIGTCGAALVNILFNIWFIPLCGYKAAAYTTAASYVMLLLLHYCICRFVLKKNIFNTGVIIKYILLVVAYGVVILLLLDNIWARCALMLIVLIPLLLWNGSKIKMLFTEVKI